MSRCPDARALLPAYVEKELGAAESRRVAGHLAICAACRREEAHYRQALGLLAAPREAVSPGDLYAGFAAKLSRYETRAAQGRLRLRWAASAACLILMVGAGASMLNRHRALAPSGETAAVGRPPVRVADSTESVQPPAPSLSAGLPPPAVMPQPAPPRDREPSGEVFSPRRIARAEADSNADLSVNTTRRVRRMIRRTEEAVGPGGKRPQVVAALKDKEKAPTLMAATSPNALEEGIPGAFGNPEGIQREGTVLSVPMASAGADSSALTEKKMGGQMFASGPAGPAVRRDKDVSQPLCIVPDLNERIQVGDTVTHVRSASGYDAGGKLALIRIKVETRQVAATGK